MNSQSSPHSSPPSYEFTFLRHAQSKGNAEGRYQGQADFPLTEYGLRQAQTLADHWERNGIEFDLVISSPLARAHHTAEIIAHKLGVALEIDPVWMERDTGVNGSMRSEEMRCLYPSPEFLSPYSPIHPDAESFCDLYLRASRGYAALLQKDEHAT